MAWVWLVAAVVMEVAGTLSLKLSAGLTRLWPSLGVLACYAGAFALLAQTLRSFEVGTAYTLWSGLGTALIVVAGVVLFGEGLGAAKLTGILLVVGGVVLLNVSGVH